MGTKLNSRVRWKVVTSGWLFCVLGEGEQFGGYGVLSVQLQGIHAGKKSLCPQSSAESQNAGWAMETEFPSHPPEVASSTCTVVTLRQGKKLAVLLPGSDVLCWRREDFSLQGCQSNTCHHPHKRSNKELCTLENLACVRLTHPKPCWDSRRRRITQDQESWRSRQTYK